MRLTVTRLACAAIVTACVAVNADELGRHGRELASAVYVMTNAPSGNAVLMFRRNANGQLTLVDRQRTGGRGGTGNGVGALDPLGSQDSLVANGDASRLLAVNGGSDEISALGVSEKGLTLLSTIKSGGDFPNSIALHRDLVYVLNAHGTPNVSGFRLAADGVLRALPGSTRPLPGGSAAVAHDVTFSADGTRLIVTEEMTNQLVVFDVGNDGLLTAVTTTASAGLAPFGSTFARDGFLIVTEAASSSVSSYEVTSTDTLIPVSPAVPNGQAASCWISLTPHGQAFISNTGSATLSSYQVGPAGQLTLVNAVAATTGNGSAPIDSALSSDSRFLYVVDSAQGRIVGFAVNGTSLTPLGAVTNLPTTLQGIVAR